MNEPLDFANCPYREGFAELLKQAREQAAAYDKQAKEAIALLAVRLMEVEKIITKESERTIMIFEILKEIKAKVEIIEQRPGKKWDRIVDIVVTFVVTAILAYVFIK